MYDFVHTISLSNLSMYRTGSEEWTAGVLGGRVLEVREPANAQEENHFMSVTITQAQ